MTTGTPTAARPRPGPDLRDRVAGWSPAVLLALASAAAGLVLGVLGVRLGPVVVLALPVGAVLVAAALSRPVVAAALLPLALPVGLVALPGGLLQVADAAVVLVVALVVAARLTAGPALLPAPVGTGLLLLLLALVALAVPTAADPGVAVKQAASLVVGGLGVLAVAGACRGVRDVRVVAALLLLTGTGVCATALFQAGQVRGTAGGRVVAGATGIFTEHNQLGGFAAAVLLVAVGLLLGARGRGARLGAGVAVAVALVALALALSRGAYLGTLLGGLLLLALLPQARRALVLAGLPLVLVGGLLAAYAPDTPQVRLVGERLASFGDPGGNPADERPAIWSEALRQVALDPWTGSGPANYPLLAQRSTSRAVSAAPEHAHDVLLTTAAEAGLPAALALVALTVVWARALVRTVRALRDPRDAAVAAGLAAALAAFVGQGVFDVTLRSPVLLVLLCLCTGLALALTRPALGPSAPAQDRGPGAAAVAQDDAGRRRAG